MALLQVKDLKTYFPVVSPLLKRKVGEIKAVDGIRFSLQAGQTLSLVGESGCGKTTASRTIMQILPATSGQVLFNGVCASTPEFKSMRSKMQMIFQDPYASLNPRHTVLKIVEEPLQIYHKGLNAAARRDKVINILSQTGLSPDALRKYPHEFSGGQRQRIAIARTLILQPQLIIADEPVSALDVSVQAQIINLLKQLQNTFNIAYLFISHDLGVVRHISDVVAIMYLGKIVEMGSCEEIFTNPQHPYTQRLIDSIPVADPAGNTAECRNKTMLLGEAPSPQFPPRGCAFHPRCEHAMPQCSQEQPQLQTINAASNASDTNESHVAACHLLSNPTESKTP